MVKNYCPEMGEKRLKGQIKMSIGHYGGYYLETKLELKGRGIKLVESNDGFNFYRSTDLAFEKIKQQYEVVHEVMLD